MTTPRLADVGEARLLAPGVLLVATIRRDGTPRVSPVEPLLLGYRMVVGRFHLFTVDIDYVAFVRYDSQSGDQYVALWPSGRQYVRRSDSATSVGRPEPTTEALG